jgi:hypothetical protein
MDRDNQVGSSLHEKWVQPKIAKFRLAENRFWCDAAALVQVSSPPALLAAEGAHPVISTSTRPNS